MRVESGVTFGCVVVQRLSAAGEAPSDPPWKTPGLWWPLRTMVATDDEARELTSTLDLEFFQFETDRPHVCDDLGLLASYIRVCDRLAIECHAILCRLCDSVCTVPPWIETLQGRSMHPGFDVNYAAGGYSFINVEYADLELQQFLNDHLNDHRLLSTQSDVRRFLDLYVAASIRRGTMEELDGALPLELWIDKDMRELRRLATRER